MSRRFINPVLHFLRGLAGQRAASDATDDLLLRRFATGHDDAAFAALLQRHAAVVLSVCRRVLGNADDAEDAFQATFLVLARQAATGFRPRTLASWLHGVAYRTAQRARRDAARRRVKEQQAVRPAICDPPTDALWAELRPVLDEEINRLPEKFRAPFILCYLHGKTNGEAAEELGCPRGTVLSRLATARERLRVRLERRGITLSLGTVTVLLAKELEATTPAPSLAAAALRVALANRVANGAASSTIEALAEAGMHTTGWLKARTAALVLLLAGVLAVGGALYANHAAPQAGEKIAGPGRPVQEKTGNERPEPLQPSVGVFKLDVGDIVAKGSFWHLKQGMVPGSIAPGQREDVAEGLTRSLLELLLSEDPRLADRFVGKKAPYHLQLLNRKQLELRADRKTHEKVKELLGVIRRLLDQAVVVETKLYEMDRKAFEKESTTNFPPRRPGNPPVFAYPATEETEQAFLNGKLPDRPLFKGLKPLAHNKVTIQDRERGEIFSWRTAVPYERSSGRIFRKKELAIAYPGFSFSMAPAVYGDRRKTRIRLTQKVTQLVGWQRVTAEQLLANQKTREISFDVPILQEASFTSTFDAFDGWGVVVPVQWRRSDARSKDRVLVLFLRAQILIEEEERQIRKAQEAGKKKP